MFEALAADILDAVQELRAQRGSAQPDSGRWRSIRDRCKEVHVRRLRIVQVDHQRRMEAGVFEAAQAVGDAGAPLGIGRTLRDRAGLGPAPHVLKRRVVADGRAGAFGLDALFGSRLHQLDVFRNLRLVRHRRQGAFDPRIIEFVHQFQNLFRLVHRVGCRLRQAPGTRIVRQNLVFADCLTHGLQRFEEYRKRNAVRCAHRAGKMQLRRQHPGLVEVARGAAGVVLRREVRL